MTHMADDSKVRSERGPYEETLGWQSSISALTYTSTRAIVNLCPHLQECEGWGVVPCAILGGLCVSVSGAVPHVEYMAMYSSYIIQPMCMVTGLAGNSPCWIWWTKKRASLQTSARTGCGGWIH